VQFFDTQWIIRCEKLKYLCPWISNVTSFFQYTPRSDKEVRSLVLFSVNIVLVRDWNLQILVVYCIELMLWMPCIMSMQIHHHHHHRIASVVRRIARPRPRVYLQRSAGVWLVSFRIWSIHLPRGRPGRRLQEGWGRRPSERLTWDCNGLCAGVLSCNLAMWPKTAMRRCRMTSLMAGRPVSADISELRTNCLHEILSICVGISYGMPPGTWPLLKWESMSRRHRLARTGRERGEHVFWWEGLAGVPSRYCPKTTLLRRPKWSACGRLVGSIHRMTVDFRDM